MPDRFIVREAKEGLYTYWVMDIIDGKIFVTVRRSEAKIFKAVDLPEWQARPAYAVVELPEDEFLGRIGQPRLEGF